MPRPAQRTHLPGDAPVAQTQRLDHIDFLKGFAIISVILLHALPEGALRPTLAPFHIWQSVPIFLFVAGITTSISFERAGGLTGYYRKLPTNLVYLAFWYSLFLFIYGAVMESVIPLRALYLGLIGPGGYFVPLIIQHMLFFPLLLSLKRRMNNEPLFLLCALLINAFLEYIAYAADINPLHYRIAYLRYIFVAALGAVVYSSNVKYRPSYSLLPALSILYILSTEYKETFSFSFNLPIINDWGMQHYPAYFYTAFLCVMLTKISAHIPFSKYITMLGKASYFIYLWQTVFFITLWEKWRDYPSLRIVAAIPVCLLGGLLIQHAIDMYASYKKGLSRKLAAEPQSA